MFGYIHKRKITSYHKHSFGGKMAKILKFVEYIHYTLICTYVETNDNYYHYDQNAERKV